jgi:hypothetical protein
MSEYMATKQQYQIAAVVIAAVLITGTAVYLATRTLRSSGIIKSVGIEIYSDATLETKISSIDWGNIDVGGAAYIDIWIQNTKNTPLTLTFGSANFIPDASQLYLTLTSDILPETVLDVNQSIKTRLTLTVSDQIQDIEAFSFDVIVNANQYTAK